MSEGLETTTTAPAAATVAAEVKDVAAQALTLFDALAASHIEANEGDARDKNPKIRFGITRAMLGDFLNRRGPASAAELAAITEDTAREVLYRRYWLPLGMDKLPEPVASALFDVAVRKGVEDAGKLLQRALATTVDVAVQPTGRVGVDEHTAIGQLVKDGNAIALATQIVAHRSTFVFRLFDGKLFGRDVDFARAAVLVGKAALTAKTGIKL